MAVLGIYEGHNAGAALVSERSGEVVAVIEEERFSRIKNHDARPGAGSLPIRSIRWCLERAHETHEPVAAIAAKYEKSRAVSVLVRRGEWVNYFVIRPAR